MRVALFLVMTLLLAAQAGAQITLPKNEYAFQCGALYGIFWKISEEKNDSSDVKIYKEKFNKLADIAERQFTSAGKSKEEAELYMQRHVDYIVKLATKDANMFFSFKKICDNFIEKL